MTMHPPTSVCSDTGRSTFMAATTSPTSPAEPHCRQRADRTLHTLSLHAVLRKRADRPLSVADAIGHCGASSHACAAISCHADCCRSALRPQQQTIGPVLPRGPLPAQHAPAAQRATLR